MTAGCGAPESAEFDRTDECGRDRNDSTNIVEGATVGCFPDLHDALGDIGVDQVSRSRPRRPLSSPDRSPVTSLSQPFIRVSEGDLSGDRFLTATAIAAERARPFGM